MYAYLCALILTALCALNVVASPSEIISVVETVVAKEEPFSFKRRYIGVIGTEYFSLLKPQVSGTIDEINVKADQAVKKNQRLFSLDNSDLKKSVLLDQKNLALAKKALSRSLVLKKTHDVTKAQVDQDEHAVLAAEQKLADSKNALKNSEIEAPFDGVVGVPRVVMGQSVTPADTLISIRQGIYSVTLRIPASRLKEIAVGQAVLVNKETAHIDAVERSVDPLTRTGFAKATLKSCARCIVGSSVFADVTIEDKPKAIMLSRNVIFYEKGQPHVVVVKTDQAQKSTAEIRPVSLGKEQDAMVEILSGLRPGEVVVKANAKRLRPGSLLKVLP